MKTVNLLNKVQASEPIKSVWFDIGDNRSFSLPVCFTGRPSGKLQIEAAIAINGQEPNKSLEGVCYMDLPETLHNVIEGRSHFYNMRDAEYNWIRLIWEPAEGVGAITAHICIKG